MKSLVRIMKRFFHLPQPEDLPPEGVGTLPDRLLAFIWFFVRQAKGAFLLILLLNAVATFIEASVPWFIKVIVDDFSKYGRNVDFGGALFWPVVAFVTLVLLVDPILSRIRNWVLARVQPSFTNLMRRQMALYMHRHSYRYFQDDFSGRLASKGVETSQAVMNIVQSFVTGIWYAFVTFLTTGFLFAVASAGAAMILGGWFLVYILVLVYFIPKILKASKETHDNVSHIRGRFVDTLSNILSVKLFARRAHEDAYLLESLKKTSQSGQKMMDISNAMYIALEVLRVVFLAATFYYAIHALRSGEMSAGDAAMILPLVLRMMNVAWWMSDVMTQLFQNLGQVQEGMETITRAVTVLDCPDSRILEVKKGDIVLEKVDFSYTDHPMFSRLDLRIPAGQRVGLVGASGAGKSSLVQLLLRLYDIQGGTILIDGQDISVVTQDSLREQISVIPQNTELFHRSLRDNIRYGRLDAGEEDVTAAARQANAHEFILELSDRDGRRGYDAFVGERGVKLSGGQRQRIAIARAILKNAPILILDEATSALDSESERLIQDSLWQLMQGRTVIAIAHRLSTIARLDRLIVMERGAIVEDGTHEALLAKGGVYARLWGLQSGGFIGGSKKAPPLL